MAISQSIERPSIEPTLTFADHLEELRRRLGICLAAFLVTTVASWTQVERIIRWLQAPAAAFLPRFAFFSPTEPIVAYIQVAVLAGVVLAMPIMLWQLWGFVRTGLTWRERYYGMLFVWWGSVQFIVGVTFAYYGLLPASLKFLLGIGHGLLEPMVSIDRYLSFITTLMFWCGVIFELPVLLLLLAKIGIVTSEWLRQQRPMAILALVIIAAIVTPTTDPVNLLLMAIPMIALYEISIWVTRWAMPASGKTLSR